MGRTRGSCPLSIRGAKLCPIMLGILVDYVLALRTSLPRLQLWVGPAHRSTCLECGKAKEWATFYLPVIQPLKGHLVRDDSDWTWFSWQETLTEPHFYHLWNGDNHCEAGANAHEVPEGAMACGSSDRSTPAVIIIIGVFLVILLDLVMHHMFYIYWRFHIIDVTTSQLRKLRLGCYPMTLPRSHG